MELPSCRCWRVLVLLVGVSVMPAVFNAVSWKGKGQAGSVTSVTLVSESTTETERERSRLQTFLRIPSPLREPMGSGLPGLVIAGVDKGGTSEAWAMIAHEFQAQTPCHRHKELGCLYKYGQGAVAVQDCYKSCFNLSLVQNSSNYLPVDGTPSYLYGGLNLEAKPVSPATLFKFSPEAAVLLLLRKPLDRARSLYNHWCKASSAGPPPIRAGCESSLESLLSTELQFLHDNDYLVKQFLNASCINRSDCDLWSPMWQYRTGFEPSIEAGQRKHGHRKHRHPYILTGMYFPFVYTWAQCTKARQLAVMQSEYFWQDPRRLWTVLGVSSDYVPLQPENKANAYTARATLSPTVAKQIEDTFKEPTELLRSYLLIQSSSIIVVPCVSNTTWWPQ